MPMSPIRRIVRHLRRVALAPEDGAPSDAELLQAFVSRRDEAAFEALLHRHGPMVWAVCRRLLHHEQDAEDAFQATFLVLVRKARSVRPGEPVAAWLHGVARYAALKVKTATVRRRAKERQAADHLRRRVAETECPPDRESWLDEELARLPEKYRQPVVLCDLEGRTRKEAARHLGWPEGTVSGRLSRARALLARRLARRGGAVPAGALAVALAAETASAGVPLSLVASTMRAVALPGGCPQAVAAVVQGVHNMLLWNRLRGWLWVLVASAVLGGGSVLVAQAGRAAPDNDSAAAGQRVAAEDSKAGRLDKAPDRGPGHKPRGRLSGYTFVLDRIDVRRRLITTHIKGGELNTGDLEPIKWNVAPDAEIIIACKPARLADLRAGMVVRLTLDREDPPADTLGTVYKIEVAADGKASRPATAGEEGNHIDIKTASLDAVDVKHRRISVSIGPKPTLGGKLQDAEGNPLGERPTKLVDLPVAADADITISLRDLPSVGNHVQRQLGELAKLKVGTPVSLRLAQRDGKPVVSKITVWRD